MCVGEVGVLEDELVQLRAAEHPVVVHVERVEAVPAEAPRGRRRVRRRTVGLRVLVVAVAHREVLRGIQVGVALAVTSVLAIRASRRRRLLREQALQVDRLERVLLRPLHGAEEVRLVLDDRAAEAAAELVAAVVLLVDVAAASRSRSSRSSFVSRKSSKKLPCRLFVPLLVTMFITPPLLRPYSAL